MLAVLNAGGLVPFCATEARLNSKNNHLETSADGADFGVSNATSNIQKPLSRIKVLDLTHAVMGPCASLVLADMGADVVHVEPPEGDPTRILKGFGMGYFPSTTATNAA